MTKKAVPTSRRTLLTALPVTSVALALPAPIFGEPEADTPILRLFRQHRKIIDAAGAHVCAAEGKAEDEELERLFYRRADRIEAELMALPCTCAADFAAKVIVDTCQGGLFSDWETGAIWQEARALTASA